MKTKVFFQFEIIINVIVSSSFKYICHGSTVLEIFLLFHCRDQLYTAESDVYIFSQIVTYKDRPHAERVKALKHQNLQMFVLNENKYE